MARWRPPGRGSALKRMERPEGGDRGKGGDRPKADAKSPRPIPHEHRATLARRAYPGAVRETIERFLAEAEASRQRRLTLAARALEKTIRKRGVPMSVTQEAIPLLMGHGLTRAEARQLLQDREGQAWRIERQTARRGRPQAVYPPPA